MTDDPDDTLSFLPRDLVAVKTVASRLGVRTRQLVDLSEVGRFPPIFEPLPGAYRVSEAEVERWLAATTVEARAATARMRVDYVRQRSSERWAKTEAVRRVAQQRVAEGLAARRAEAAAQRARRGPRPLEGTA